MKIIRLIKKNLFVTASLVLLLSGIFFRFYNLSWGSPYFFHPDERNIANSINQLSFPSRLDPHFFAYGSLPIYGIYFIGVTLNFISSLLLSTHLAIAKVSFENAILIGRVISALLSVLVLYLIYALSKKINGKKGALISTVLASLSVGFIQYAHFATFEIWLSVFTLLLVFTTIKFYQTKKLNYVLYSSVLIGFLISIKVSSLIYLPLFLIILAITEVLIIKRNDKTYFLQLEKTILKVVISCAITLIVIFITSPYFWFDSSSFLSSIHYETSVATGVLPVFYSQGFLNTTPIVYQLTKVYPFILNPFILILFIPTFLYILFKAIKSRNVILLILILFFLATFLSQAFLFVKWTRYYIPSLAFIYILLGYNFCRIQIFKKSINIKIKKILLIGAYSISLLFAFSYFKTVLLSSGPSIEALKFATKNIPPKSQILSEVFDLGIIPFNAHFSSISLFNFYDLDTDNNKQKELDSVLKTTDYIILPSQRIIRDRVEKPNIFPNGNNFYKKLQDGRLEFTKIYETPCDLFCKILYLRDPIYRYEETTSVFDRPTVMIFKHEH